MLPDRLPEAARGIGNKDESIRRESRELTLHGKEPVSFSTLMDGVLRRSDIPDRPSGYKGIISAVNLYEDLAQRPSYGFKVTHRTSGEQEYCVVGPELNGLETHAILYFPSPDKYYGFDNFDVLVDEDKLFNPKSKEDEKRLKAHRTMPGWKE